MPAPRLRTSAWRTFLPSLAIGGLILWAGVSVDIDLGRLFAAGPRLADFGGRLYPPDFSVLPEVLQGTGETLRIAILGTVACIVLSAVLGLLAAETVTPPAIYRPVKALLALIRSIPLLIVAMLMVASVGLGPLPGILAIAFHATGMLAKFYAEAIEGVDHGPLAALDSSGASFLQRLRFGVWPQMAPDVIRDTLFRFELNLRESLVLGLVGAGGVGFYISTYVGAFQYDKAATVAIVIAIIVVGIELANAWLRRLAR